MKTQPLAISGPWKKGFSLDVHTVSSEFLGHDVNGVPKFDTMRSEIGEALYRCKYQHDIKAVFGLADVAARFVREQKFPIDLVVPLPPSKARAVQPVAAIAKEIATMLGIPYASKGLRKIKETPELKSMSDLPDREAALAGAFSSSPEIVKGKTVLLFDDLYRSGVSMKEAARTLLGAGEASAVYALALTRTRKNL